MHEVVQIMPSLLIETADFEPIQPIVILDGNANITLVTINDDITLEYDDTIVLRFNPYLPFEESGEFIRDTIAVNIIDNDRK